METKAPTITVETTVQAPIKKAWNYWTKPEHITQWYQASDDWHAPVAENDLEENGRFKTTMAAKDGSARFDFTGKYNLIREHNLIDYTLDDGRMVQVNFTAEGPATHISQTFEPESTNTIEMQRAGWQAILDNFKKYVEGH